MKVSGAADYQQKTIIPAHNNWIVTLWHFGTDSLVSNTVMIPTTISTPTPMKKPLKLTSYLMKKRSL
jgi:hypothetical protein